MLQIPPSFFKNQTIYRSLSNDTHNGLLACGFLNKKSINNSDINIEFEHYGALVILSGEGKHVDSDGNEYKLYPGCFVQRIPGKLHSTYVKPDGKWLEFFICFGKQLYQALANINVLDGKQDVMYPGINTALFNTFKSFMHSLQNAQEDELPMLLAESQKIIFTIYSMHKQNSTNDTDRISIRQACQLLYQSPSVHISAIKVSQELGIGYEKFRKLFKVHMGISPGSFVMQKRINAAKSLLIENNFCIKEIALELGFSDTFTFSKQFKKVVGLSPSEFRSMFK